MTTNTSPQINVRLPVKLLSAAEQYVENYGYRNMQELILEAIRDKIFKKKNMTKHFLKGK